MDLSICIVNWNSGEDLRICLESIYKYSGDLRLEVIVVDNASWDNSVWMVRRKFPEVKLIANRVNRGYAKANNQAIGCSCGRYILLLNPDAQVLKGALQALVSFMDAHPEVGVAGPKIVDGLGRLQFSCRRFPTLGAGVFRNPVFERLFPNNRFTGDYLMIGWGHDEVREVDWVSGACMLIRREVVEEVGGLDERYFMYCEDVDFCYRLKQAGWRVYYVPRGTVVHLRGRSTDKAAVKSIIQFHLSMYKFYRRHYAKGLFWLLHPLIVTGLMLRALLFILKNRYDYCGGWILGSVRPVEALAESEKLTVYERVIQGCLILIIFFTPIFLGKIEFGQTEPSLTLPVTSLQILTAIALLVFITGFMVTGRVRLRYNRLDLLIGLFVLISLLSIIKSVNLHQSLVELGKLATYVLIYWLLVNNFVTVKPILVALLISGGLVAAYGIRQYWLVYLLEGNLTWRIFSTFFNPNCLAGFLIMLIPIGVSMYLLVSRRAQRWMIGFLTLILVVALMLTGSRGGWLAFLASIIFYFSFLSWAKVIRFNLKRLALIVIGAGVLVFLFKPIGTRILTSFSAQQHSNIFRLLLWKGTLKMIADFPVLGSGIGTFQYIYPKYAQVGFARMAHNNYLQIVAEIGLIGLVVFGLLVYRFFGYGRGALIGLSREVKILTCGFLAGMVAFLLHSLVEYVCYIPATGLLFWLIVGMIVVVSKGGVVLEVKLRFSRAKRWCMGLIFSILVLLLIFWSFKPFLGSVYISQGVKAQNEGAIDWALARYEKAVKTDRLNAKYHVYLGRLLAGFGDEDLFKEGVAELREAIRLESTNASHYFQLGLIYSWHRRWAEAIREYQQAVRLNAHHTGALLGLAKAFAVLGDEGKAFLCYKRIVEIENSVYGKYKAIPEVVDINYAYGHYGMGKIYGGQGKVDLGIEEFKKALLVVGEYRNKFKGSFTYLALQAGGESQLMDEKELQSLEGEIYNGLGELYKQKGLQAQSKYWFKKAEGMVE